MDNESKLRFRERNDVDFESLDSNRSLKRYQRYFKILPKISLLKSFCHRSMSVPSLYILPPIRSSDSSNGTLILREVILRKRSRRVIRETFLRIFETINSNSNSVYLSSTDPSDDGSSNIDLHPFSRCQTGARFLAATKYADIIALEDLNEKG